MDFADCQNMYLNYFWSKAPPSSGNVFYYTNPTVDSLLVQARSAANAATARADFKKAIDIIYNQALEIWAVQPNDRIAMRDNVHGFVYNYLYGSFYYDLYALSKS
jgi:ABC-type transport system substrate-binding protein